MKISKSELIKLAGPYGLYSLARHLTRNKPRIIMYHRFSESLERGKVCKDTFEKQIIYMKKHFNIVPLSTLCKIPSTTGLKVKNNLILTIDDGYEDFYKVAFPVLKKHNVPATLFVTTKFVDGDFWLWPDKIAWILDQGPLIPDPIKLGLKLIPKGKVNESNKLIIWSLLTGYLLTLSDGKKLDWIEEFCKEISCQLPASPPQGFKGVTWEQLNEMQMYGVEIGGHTVTHPSLGRVDDMQLRYEVEECKSKLDINLGAAKRDFCYPNGQPQDYTISVKKMVEEVGFQSSVVAFYDKLSLEDKFELRRHTVGEESFQFFKSVNGVELLASFLLGDHNRLEWVY